MGHSLYAEGSDCSGRGDCLTTESGGGSDPRGSLDHQRGGLRVLALSEMRPHLDIFLLWEPPLFFYINKLY